MIAPKTKFETNHILSKQSVINSKLFKICWYILGIIFCRIFPYVANVLPSVQISKLGKFVKSDLCQQMGTVSVTRCAMTAGD